MNGGNASLAEIYKNSGAHQKNFNEDRPISLAGKCRPMPLLAINIKCMQICAGVPSGEGASSTISANGASRGHLCDSSAFFTICLVALKAPRPKNFLCNPKIPYPKKCVCNASESGFLTDARTLLKRYK